jgi:hypothetical protein
MGGCLAPNSKVEGKERGTEGFLEEPKPLINFKASVGIGEAS